MFVFLTANPARRSIRRAWNAPLKRLRPEYRISVEARLLEGGRKAGLECLSYFP